MRVRENVEAALLALPMRLEELHSSLQAGLAQFAGTQRIDAARYLPAGGRALATNGRARLVGWSVRARGGPVSVVLRDGVDAGGEVVAVIDVPADQSQTVPLPGAGVACPNGLFIERTGAGTLEGAVWLGAVD